MVGLAHPLSHFARGSAEATARNHRRSLNFYLADCYLINTAAKPRKELLPVRHEAIFTGKQDFACLRKDGRLAVPVNFPRDGAAGDGGAQCNQQCASFIPASMNCWQKMPRLSTR